LTNETFDFSKEDLHLMGTIASGINNSSAYYICDYGQGAMVVTIKSDKIEKLRQDNHLRIMTVFPQLISQFDLNHNLALKNYLTDKGYNISEDGTKLTATKNENTVIAEFDDQSRLTKLNG
jgi:ribose 5-phosphate isomerase RpiB